VPTDMSSNVAAIDLSDNEIVDLKDGNFKGLRSLKAIYLRRNKIKKIKKNTFQHLPNLCILDLSFNFLCKESIEKGTFRDMSSLKDLRINNNAFPGGGFPDEELQSLSSLRNLSITAASEPLHFSLNFKCLKNLTKIEVNCYDSIHLKNDSFENLAELSIKYVHFIFFNSCPCRYISEDLFWAFPKIKGIRLQTLCGMRYALKSLKKLQYKNLNYVDFSSTYPDVGGMTDLNEQDVRYLRNVCAKTVNFMGTNVISIDTMKSSIFMKCIEKIDLSLNTLLYSPFIYAITEAVQIQLINVSHQSYCSSNSFSSSNRLKMSPQFPMNYTLSRSLEIIDLSNTNVSPNPHRKVHIYGLNVQYANLRYTSFPSCAKTNIKLVLPRVRFLDVSGIPCKDLDVEFLKDFHSLSELNMANAILNLGLQRDAEGVFLKGPSKEFFIYMETSPLPVKGCKI
jgi:hypothetical protein